MLLSDLLKAVALKDKIYKDIHSLSEECRNEGWDGYDALPLSEESKKYALEFIDSLSSFCLTQIMESIDIIPENNGDFCFEWFKSNNRFISISVKKDRLIFNYENEEKRGCGETNFADKNSVIQKIKEF